MACLFNYRNVLKEQFLKFKLILLSSFAHSHDVSKSYDFLFSTEHKKRSPTFFFPIQWQLAGK